MKKNIDPLISILIVIAVFTVAVFLIFQGETSLNNQLSASISKYGNKMVETTETSECLRETYNDFLTNWNQECKAEGLEDKCSLSKEIANPLKADYQTEQNLCY
ncbi:hypothetical protein KKA24_01190 [Patescibacteria group bacterium]|nr:hypothetical protein [Patescibacteria group bacterium]